MLPLGRSRGALSCHQARTQCSHGASDSTVTGSHAIIESRAGGPLFQCDAGRGGHYEQTEGYAYGPRRPDDYEQTEGYAQHLWRVCDVIIPH